jgi:hypothetical protein
VIPGQRFSARITNRFNRLRGTAESVVSKLIELDVKPIPDSYPQAPWIPASKFQINETYSRDPQDWTVGEPVTRTMTITATGLSSGQIPPIPMPEINGIRYYPDQSQDDSKVTEQGLVTTVVQSVALVPTKVGPMTLPEIQIPWWNTLTNSVEYATLPQQIIQVNQGSNIPPAASNPPAPATPMVESEQTNETSSSNNSKDSYWKPISLALIGTNLITVALLLFFITRRGSQTASSREDKAANTQGQNTAQLWQALKKAARDNNAQEIRDALIRWAGAESGRPMSSLAEAEVWLNDVRLSTALAELDDTLYSKQTNSAFNGQGIISLIESAKKQERSKNEAELPEFYPK